LTGLDAKRSLLIIINLPSSPNNQVCIIPTRFISPRKFPTSISPFIRVESNTRPLTMFLNSGCKAIPKPTARPFNKYNIVVLPNIKWIVIHRPAIKTKQMSNCTMCVKRKHLFNAYIVNIVITKATNPKTIIFKRYKCIYTIL